jgi:hypothetical protein
VRRPHARAARPLLGGEAARPAAPRRRIARRVTLHRPACVGPWEHAIAVCFFGYLGYRAGTLREFMEERVMLMAKERIVADKDKLNEKYRLILGDEKYAKWFPEEQSA